jgi:DnaJ-class molecular chaperone
MATQPKPTQADECPDCEGSGVAIVVWALTGVSRASTVCGRCHGSGRFVEWLDGGDDDEP